MCGITAYVGAEDAMETVLTSLENLEYRGYDSSGIALLNGAGIEIRKTEGQISKLKSKVYDDPVTGSLAIGHTRWSTHGEPSEANAHPHTDCSGRIAVVHNGIIDNHATLREELEARGHEFTSETDTEVVPHLVSEYLESGETVEEAFRQTIQRLQGSYAIAMTVVGEDGVFATRRGSPLVLGIGGGRNYLASDIPAFIEYTDQVVYLQDGDVAIVRSDGYTITDLSGEPLDRPVEVVEWGAEAAEKGGYEHFMHKEIQEQPTALRQAIEGRVIDGELTLSEFPAGSFEDISTVHLVACGTSYHAGLYGESLLNQWGVPASAHLASEFAMYPPPLGEEALVILVTQSGETADTLEAMRVATQRGAPTLALTNVVGSSVTREVDDTLFIRAGPEIGVAATKTFSSQVATLVLLGERLARDITGRASPESADRLSEIRRLPEYVESVLETSQASRIGANYLSEDGHFFIGRGNGYPVALEGALKFKEITYKHAEGFAAGELKHGPLALVTENTPVFAICSGPDATKLESNIREVQTRGAPVVAVSPRSANGIVTTADDTLTVPGTHPDLVPILANVQLQLVAYHAASTLGRAIDKPRNLAKSVTVE